MGRSRRRKKRGGVRGRREKSQKGNEGRGREAKRRREPKLLIFKHVQQRPQL